MLVLGAERSRRTGKAEFEASWKQRKAWRRWKKCRRDSRANDQVSSSVALTPQGKGFASDETRFPAYETRLKQSACIMVLGSVLTKSLPGHSPKPLPWAWTS